MPARRKVVTPVADAPSRTPADHDAISPPSQDIQAFFLARIATSGGATRSTIAKDLAPYFSNKLSPAEWRRLTDTVLTSLIERGLAEETRNRFTATSAGLQCAASFLGLNPGTCQTWQMQRDVALIAKALAIETESQAKLKALAKPDGLRAMIVQKAFGLPIRKNISPAKLRAQLALVALERAFGNKIKSSLGPRSPLPAKVSLALAGQLAEKSRSYTSDAQLIAALAAEAVGARQTTLDELRAMIMRNFAASVLAAEEPEPAPPEERKPSAQKKTKPKKKPRKQKRRTPALTPANDTQPADLSSLQSDRPDVAEFARVVNTLASDASEGWPGNMKAFISRVSDAIRTRYPQWNLSDIEFKCMLVEAHRTGRVVLAGADLKNKDQLAEFERSAITYKNTVWHYIRVEH